MHRNRINVLAQTTGISPDLSFSMSEFKWEKDAHQNSTTLPVRHPDLCFPHTRIVRDGFVLSSVRRIQLQQPEWTKIKGLTPRPRVTP